MKALLLIALLASVCLSEISAQIPSLQEQTQQHSYNPPIVSGDSDSNQKDQHAQHNGQQHVHQHIVNGHQHVAHHQHGQQVVSNQVHEHAPHEQTNGQQHHLNHAVHVHHLPGGQQYVPHGYHPVHSYPHVHDQVHDHHQQSGPPGPQQVQQGQQYIPPGTQQAAEGAPNSQQFVSGGPHIPPGPQQVPEGAPDSQKFVSDGPQLRANVPNITITGVVKHEQIPHKNFEVPEKVQQIVHMVHQHIPQVINHQAAHGAAVDDKNSQSQVPVVHVPQVDNEAARQFLGTIVSFLTQQAQQLQQLVGSFQRPKKEDVPLVVEQGPQVVIDKVQQEKQDRKQKSLGIDLRSDVIPKEEQQVDGVVVPPNVGHIVDQVHEHVSNHENTVDLAKPVSPVDVQHIPQVINHVNQHKHEVEKQEQQGVDHKEQGVVVPSKVESVVDKVVQQEKHKLNKHDHQVAGVVEQ